MKQVASEQRILSAGSMFRIGNLDQAFMIVTSIGQRSAFNFTYQFFPSNITYQDTTISNIGKDQNNSTTKAQIKYANITGAVEVSKIDSTTVVILAAIFGTLGGILAIFMLYCAIEKMIELFKKWRTARVSTVATKPLTSEDELGTERKKLKKKVTLNPVTEEGGNFKKKPTSIKEVGKQKWQQRVQTTVGDDHQEYEEDEEEYGEEIEEDQISELPKKISKVPNKKAQPPMKKLFLDGKLSDATPSTADQDDPFRREQSRAPRS